jgi:hypothetical protein
VVKKEQRGSFQFVVMKIGFDNYDIDIDRKLRWEYTVSVDELLSVLQ